MDERDNSDGKNAVIDNLLEHSVVAAAIAEPEDDVEGSSRKRSPPIVFKRRVRHQPTCCQQTGTCVKRTCVYMLSYVGLTCFVVLYSVLGGFVFAELESAHEEQTNEHALQIKADFITKISNSLSMVLKLHNISRLSEIDSIGRSFTDEYQGMLERFQQETYRLVSKEGWNGEYRSLTQQLNDTTISKWTFTGSLLYSVTVITTIGKGGFYC